MNHAPQTTKTQNLLSSSPKKDFRQWKTLHILPSSQVSVKKISQLKNFRSSTKVTFHLNSKAFSEEEMTSLSKSIKSLKGLSEISIEIIPQNLNSVNANLELPVAILRALRYLSNLKIFRSNIPQIFKGPNGAIFNITDALTRNNRIQFVEIDLSKCQNLINHELYNPKGLKSSNIKTLDLNLTNFRSMEAPAVNSIFGNALMSQNKAVEELNLNLGYSHQLVDDNVSQILTKVGNMNIQKLRTLNMNFEQCENIQQLPSLDNILMKLSSIKRLDLSFRMTKFNQQVSERLQNLGENVFCLNELKSLKLDFYKCSDQTKDSLSNFLSSIQNLFTLEELNLNLGCCQIAQIHVAKIANMILQNPMLKRVNLDLQQNPQLNSQDLVELAESFQNCRQLQSISLDLSQNPNLSIREFASKIERINLNFLKNFELNIRQCSNIGNDDLQALSRAFSNMKALERLVFKVDRSSKITDQGISAMYNEISKLRKISDLDIELTRLNNLTNSSLRTLGSALKKMPKINTLAMDFSYCNCIKDEGILDLTGGVLSLNSLANFTIRLTSLDFITDKSVVALSLVALKFRKLLKNVSIITNFCSNLTDLSINGMIEQLRKCQNLVNIEFLFKWCGNIKKGWVANSKELNKLPKLRNAVVAQR